MRLLFNYSMICCVLICSCSVSSPVQKSSQEIRLLGKWTYTGHYYSIGGPGNWRPISPGGQTIEFKADGSFIPAASFLNNANRFEILDSATIKFQPATTSSGFILMGYKLDSAENLLYMYPVNPACIEGCNDKFSRKL